MVGSQSLMHLVAIVGFEHDIALCLEDAFQGIASDQFVFDDQNVVFA